MTLTAAAATALRGAATLKARTLKEVWNIAAVIPVDKVMGVTNGGNGGSNGSSNGSFSGELVPEENFLGICSRELLARGGELLKRTRKGDAEDEEQTCRWDPNEKEKECSAGSPEGHSGLARPPPARRWRTPEILCVENSGTRGRRVRVQEPKRA
ncbi:UNVERIFIED_CONTAM: VAN3-binding protein [Sesamum angustifolium]|uniref:VAN3-binding protein n=1 Tax=Sesamum angustifolium TaxID=2727405 RepID=A0AAW2JMJ8_9LAMI